MQPVRAAEPQTLGPADRARLEAATRLHAEGRLAEAEAAYLGLLDAPGAERAVLHFVLGLVRGQWGDKAGALAHHDRAAALGCAAPALPAQRAELLRGAGRLTEALAAYDQALALQPDEAALHHGRGITLAALGRGEDAIAAYAQAAALDPANPRIHGNLGVALEGEGRLQDAVDAYCAALALDPAYRHAHHNLGSVLLKLEAYDLAAESLTRALQLDAGVAEAWNLLGMAYMGSANHAGALTCFDQAVGLRPAYAEALNNRAIALRWLGRFEEAVASAGRAHALDPTLVAALSSRGAALVKLNRHAEALIDLNAALALKPGFAGAVLNRGAALEALGDLDAALADYEEAERLDPGKPDGPFNRAMTYLRRGDFAAGLPLYERRWDKPTGPFLPHARERLWLGAEDIAGQTLLLHGEQGFGDVIQYARFAADVAALGARVILQVQAPLVRLMASLAGPAEVLSLADATPAFDRFTPLMSLPLALGLSLPQVARPPYLAADPLAVAAWRQRLGPARGPRVGLAWTGNPGHENDHNRSMPLQALEPLFGHPLDLISLQKLHTGPDADRIDAGEVPVRRFGAELGDFADTAALIAACDAVVAVDTSVAHLAAALGRPTLILLPRFSDWRWMDGRADTPWYGSARLLRQTTAGDWRGP